MARALPTVPPIIISEFVLSILFGDDAVTIFENMERNLTKRGIGTTAIKKIEGEQEMYVWYDQDQENLEDVIPPVE